MVDKQGEGARGQPATSAWSVPEGRRTDEWSLCVVRIAEHRDRAAFAKFFAHFAPLIKAFALWARRCPLLMPMSWCRK